MPQVSNLKLQIQAGTTNSVLATWDFVENNQGSSATSVARKGDVVSIIGDKYYNGVTIPQWVKNSQWIVLQVVGDRAVINDEYNGSHHIMSPINVHDITTVQSTQTNVLPDTIDHYEYTWQYSTGDGIYFDGNSGNTNNKYSTFSVPNNALKIKCTVKPVSKEYSSNGNNVPYWTGTAVSSELLAEALPPAKLSAPSVKLDKFVLEARLENISEALDPETAARIDKVEFEVYKGDSRFTSGIIDVITARAIYTCTVEPGAKYRVRCRAINMYENTKIYGDWSAYSQELDTIPSAVTDVRVQVQSDKSILVSWIGNGMAETYTVEYTTNRDYFDASSEVSSLTVTNAFAFITGLEQGKEWFFRVKASNSQGDSAWSEIVYSVVGTKPQPPTTWSLTSSAVIGEKIELYWVHNSEDGSRQMKAEIRLIINGEAKIIEVDTSEETKTENDRIYSYEVEMEDYPDGAEILWEVRTQGITLEYSDWSMQRTINVYAPPTIEVHVNNDNPEVNTLPLNIKMHAGPNTQNALSYHISITADDSYTTSDQLGNKMTVYAGTEIYSKVINTTSNDYEYNITPDEITLENNQFYTMIVIVSMNSGLVATTQTSFNVSWEDKDYEPGGIVVLDDETLCAYIKPYCISNDNELIDEVVLSVYRREFDGTFKLIADNIENIGTITVTDPHPALDYARYRIVARNRNTNVNDYVDLPGVPGLEKAIIIQWDEDWSLFDYTGEEEMSMPVWSGSMLKLPYNVDVSEKFDVDNNLVEYIGRRSPVGYYGTQEGVSMSLKTEFPKDDSETLYTLRRLAKWTGDVYIREPTGNGYNANVKVSFNNNYKNVTTQVTIDVTRVEGDM